MLRRVMLAAAAASGGSDFDAKVLELEPWGYWKLDESPIVAGGVAVDASGNGRAGTYRSADTVSVSGLYAGSSRAIRLPALAGQHGVGLPTFVPVAGEKLSIISFIDVPSADWSSVRAIVSADYNDGSSRRWQWRLRAGKLEFVTIEPSVSIITSTATLVAGAQHMVAVVFDQSLPAASGVVKIYIDGVLDVQSTTAITSTANYARPAIGNRTSLSTALDCFTGGTIDNVALWRSALTAADIAALWAARNS